MRMREEMPCAFPQKIRASMRHEEMEIRDDAQDAPRR